MVRCDWAKSELMCVYHDQEWGKPKYEDVMLFELLILEGLQAGLSWATILGKRNNYRKALDGFDPQKIKSYDQVKIERLLKHPGLIRHRLKMAAIVKNAKAFIQIQEEFGSFSNYLWQYVAGQPIDHHYQSVAEVPAADEISEKMSRDMKKRGFSFVGPKICYAYMQATGLVNDHIESCDYR
ncbi:MAG: DNA-3-methyladenine glycosylase I [Streptococcaceae bacterium]|nr:DNA-3-methyladenine glycosylase I [Streptococcaceae bacterium]